MPRFHNVFVVELLTPTTAPQRLQARSVVFPALDGQVGVLAGRAPMVIVLGAGKLEIEDSSAVRELFFVSGGFAHVREEGVTILAEECVPARQLDLEQIWEELEQAKSLPAEAEKDWVAKQRAVAAARAKFNLAQEYRKKARSA